MQTKVIVVPGLSKRKIEHIALGLLTEIQPEALNQDVPVDVESLYEFHVPERCGIKICYTDLSKLGPGILGYTDARYRMSFVDKTLSDSPERAMSRRFRTTVVHESFHCLHHVPLLQHFISISHRHDDTRLYRVEKSKVRPFEDPEWQAWEFARVYLMPTQRTMNYYQRGLSVRQMADIFDVNPIFVEVRLKKMGLETE